MAQWRNAKALRKGYCPPGQRCCKMFSNPSPGTISSHHCWRGRLLSVRNDNSHTDGWSRKLREGQRENKGVSCDESLPSGKQFQKPPQSSQHLSKSVLCAERNCGKWSTKPHLIAHRPDAVQRSEKEPGQARHMCQYAQHLSESPGHTYGWAEDASSSSPIF